MMHPTPAPARSRHSLRGFTLAELLVAAGLFVIVSTVALGIYVNIFSANRTTNAERQLIDEAGYVMETVVKDIRNGIIDYPEYWRWSRVDPPEAPSSGATGARADYEAYLQQSPAEFSGLESLRGDEDILSTVAAPHPGLILLSPDGTTRTVLWRRVITGGPRDGEGEIVFTHERLAYDEQAASDPLDDAWYWIDADSATSSTCAAGEAATLAHADCIPVVHVLTTSNLDVRGFWFSITPQRDPFFAYDDQTTQSQPMVRLTLDIATSATIPVSRTSPPRITLTTTVSIRSYAQAEWLSPLLLP